MDILNLIICNHVNKMSYLVSYVYDYRIKYNMTNYF